MAPPQPSIRLLIALFILLPFKLVAQITLLVAAVVFVWNPFDLARLYALIAVSMVQTLAKLQRWMVAQREEQESAATTPLLLQLERLGRAYHLCYGFKTQRTQEVPIASCSSEDVEWYLAQKGSRMDGAEALTLDSATADELASLTLPTDTRLVALRVDAVEAASDSRSSWDHGEWYNRPAKGGELPPVASRATYVVVQEAHVCVSISRDGKGGANPLTLEDVLFAARALAPDPHQRYRGFELASVAGLTDQGVLTLRPLFGS